MQVQIHSIHFDADKKLIDFVQQRLDKLTGTYEKITNSEVFLRLDKNKENENKIAEIKILVPGKELFASRQCKSFEEAVDLSVDALKAQIQKYKGKQP
ncbi:MAG: HPF/RaiA family ribosome-associated protein [Flavobacteriales bacterium]|nr:HPF/RaiA family ribosome-associated protein [Flavobacteriales bacterium]